MPRLFFLPAQAGFIYRSLTADVYGVTFVTVVYDLLELPLHRIVALQ